MSREKGEGFSLAASDQYRSGRHFLQIPGHTTRRIRGFARWRSRTSIHPRAGVRGDGPPVLTGCSESFQTVQRSLFSHLRTGHGKRRSSTRCAGGLRALFARRGLQRMAKSSLPVGLGRGRAGDWRHGVIRPARGRMARTATSASARGGGFHNETFDGATSSRRRSGARATAQVIRRCSGSAPFRRSAPSISATTMGGSTHDGGSRKD